MNDSGAEIEAMAKWIVLRTDFPDSHADYATYDQQYFQDRFFSYHTAAKPSVRRVGPARRRRAMDDPDHHLGRLREVAGIVHHL